MKKAFKQKLPIFKEFFLKNKSTKQILVKNTFWLMMGEVFAKALLFIITISVVRYLGVETYGKYSFAIAFTALFGVIVDFGLGIILVQELSAGNKKNASSIFGSILSLKFVLGIIAYSAIVTASYILHLPADIQRLVYLGGIYMLLQSFVLIFPFLFQAYESMQFSFIVRTGLNIILGIFVLSAIFLKLSVVGIFYAYILTALVMFVLSLFLVKKYFFSITFGINRIVIKYLLKQSWPLFFGNICIAIYMSADTTMLGFMRSYHDVGIYQSAYKILYVFLTLNLVQVALFPRMAQLYKTNKAGLHKLLTFLITVSLIVLIPAVTVIGVFRNQIIQLIYGSRFAGAGDVMLLLIIGGIISYFSGYFSILLLIKKKQKQWFLVLLLGLITNIVVNYLTIPVYGPIGAGVGYIGGYIVILLSYIFFLILVEHNSLCYAVCYFNKKEKLFLKDTLHERK